MVLRLTWVFTAVAHLIPKLQEGEVAGTENECTLMGSSYTLSLHLPEVDRL